MQAGGESSEHLMRDHSIFSLSQRYIHTLRVCAVSKHPAVHIGIRASDVRRPVHSVPGTKLGLKQGRHSKPITFRMN